MKKQSVCITILSCIALSVMSGCVDKNYDLRNMERNEIYVGNVITTPPISVKLPFEGIAGGIDAVEQILADNGLTMEDLGLVPVEIDTDYSVNISLENPMITSDILEYFNVDEGSTALLLDIENTLRMSFTLQLEFCDIDGVPIISFDSINIDAAEENSTSMQNVRLDVSDVLSQLDQIYQVNVSLSRLDVQKIVFDLDDYLLLNIRLEKTGGINLFPDEK